VSARGKWPYLLLAILVAGLDLTSKAWAFAAVASQGVSSSLHYGEKAITVVPGFFYIARVWNPGGIWGIAQSGLLSTALVVFRAVAVPLLFFLALRVSNRDRLLLTALGLFAAGAVGNLYDNVVYDQGVRDFLDFFLFGENGYHWPTFNVADAAICCGVILVLLETFFGKHVAAKNTAGIATT
jgi:signal peptidase II